MKHLIYVYAHYPFASIDANYVFHHAFSRGKQLFKSYVQELNIIFNLFFSIPIFIDTGKSSDVINFDSRD